MACHANWMALNPDLDIYEAEAELPRVDTLSAGPAKDSLTAIRNALIAHRDSVNKYALPKKFSQIGFYADMARKTVSSDFIYYEVNTPLWSDGAHKTRWVWIPAGTKIQFNENSDYWNYPDGAAFIKNFKLYQVPGDTATLVWWETRVLINKETPAGHDRWKAFTYRWNPEGTDATLIPYDAEDDSLNYTFEEFPAGKGRPSRLKKWHYPNRDQCMACHRNEYSTATHGRTVLGFFAAQINRNAKGNAPANQIAEFFAKGLFAWEAKGGQVPTATDIDGFPKWHGLTDSLVDIDKRARAYMAANCSGCHGDRGNANNVATGKAFNFDYWDNKNRTKLGNFKISWDYTIPPNEYGVAKLLVPGQPDLSVLLFRQLQRSTYEADIAKWTLDSSETKPAKPRLKFDDNTLQMPPLGVYEIDTVAAKVIRAWILDFDTTDQMTSIRRKMASAPMAAPILQGGQLILPQSWMGAVSLYDVTGREMPLSRITHSIYNLPPQMRPGIYLVRIGKRGFTQYLF